MTETDAKIREALKRVIEAQQLTQAELAQRLGIKQPSVADLLSGRRGRIPQSLLDMLDALDMELTAQPRGEGKA